MAVKDLREWIDILEAEGELHRVKAQVDWNLEIGGIAQKIFDGEGPALLFENIKDHKETRCTRLFTASMCAYRRIAMMMGLPRDTPVKELIKTFMQRTDQRVPVKRVKSGPCKQNIIKGKEVDLFQFPAPKWHPKDGGRAFNTYGGVITQDPETGWINVGLYRMMIHDKTTLGTLIVPTSHWGQHLAKYRKMGKPMPVAVVNGWDQALPVIGCTTLPQTSNDYEVVGGLRGRPVEVVKCETNDLEVPATAEIIVEGTVNPDPDSYRMEGPFGEYTGTYGGWPSKKPVLEVKCVTHRDNPIFQGTMEGFPINEDHRVASISTSAMNWKGLINAGVPGVTAVFNPPSSSGWTNTFVQIEKRYQGHARQVANALWGLGIAYYSSKHVMVVDTDIDIFDFNALNYALAYRVDAKRSIVIMEGCVGSPLDPIADPTKKDPMIHGGARWNRMLIDATIPFDWEPRPEWDGRRFPPSAYPPQEVMELVERRWKEYGFKAERKK